MSGFSVASDQHLIRSSLWSSQLKEILQDELFATKYVDWITDFPDGTTINIPSIGQAEAYDYVEGQAVKYTAMDTGNFQFSVNEYKASGTYITNKMKQDSFYVNRLISQFVPKQHRAIMKSMEAKVLDVGPSAQTATQPNTINGGDHRFGATGANQTILPQDIAKAVFSLQMANVPLTNLVGIVHPAVGYHLQTMTNLVNVSNNPRWEGIIRDGMVTGTKFLMNIYGVDIYTSQNLKTIASESITPSVGNAVSVTNGVANIFFSAAPDLLPFVGQVRQQPKVDSEYNKDLQREEYVTTARYDFALFRPENLVTILSSKAV
jgi:hypothetical protein